MGFALRKSRLLCHQTLTSHSKRPIYMLAAPNEGYTHDRLSVHSAGEKIWQVPVMVQRWRIWFRRESVSAPAWHSLTHFRRRWNGFLLSSGTFVRSWEWWCLTLDRDRRRDRRALDRFMALCFISFGFNGWRSLLAGLYFLLRMSLASHCGGVNLLSSFPRLHVWVTCVNVRRDWFCLRFYSAISHHGCLQRFSLCLSDRCSRLCYLIFFKVPHIYLTWPNRCPAFTALPSWLSSELRWVEDCLRWVGGSRCKYYLLRISWLSFLRLFNEQV